MCLAVCNDDLLKEWFNKLDAEKLKVVQGHFLLTVLGGDYWGVTYLFLTQHNCTSKHIDQYFTQLKDACTQLDIPPWLIDNIIKTGTAKLYAVLSLHGKKQLGTLYHRIGGAEALNKVVEILYKKLMSENKIAVWFAGVDVEKIKEKQKTLLAYAFGEGSVTYTGSDLELAHSRLVQKGLSDEHYDIFVKLIKETLNEAGCDASLSDEAMEVIELLRDAVLCRDYWF